MAIKSIDLGWITVSDLKRSRDFFENMLGMRVISESEEYKWLELVGKDGGAMLGIGQFDPQHGSEKPGHNAILTFTVDNLDNLIVELKVRGVRFLGDVMEVPGHVKMVFFADPDGNKFQLVESLDNK